MYVMVWSGWQVLEQVYHKICVRPLLPPPTLPSRPVSLFLSFHRALTACRAIASNVESPVNRLRTPNSTSSDPAPAVHVSLILPEGTPLFRFTCIPPPQKKEKIMRNKGNWMWQLEMCWTHPGVRDTCAGVLKGGQQTHGQVVCQAQQLVVIVLKLHPSKWMLGIRE